MLKKYLCDALLVSGGAGLVALGSSLAAYRVSVAGGICALAVGLVLWAVEYIRRSREKSVAVAMVFFLIFGAGVSFGFFGVFIFRDPLAGVALMLVCGIPAFLILEGLDAHARNRRHSPE